MLGEAPGAQPVGGLVEGEAGPAQDDPERGEAERDEERGHDRLERGRESGPQNDEDEDQPDVVCLPHRPDRPVDEMPGALSPLPAAADEGPEPCPEVGSPENGVERDSDPEHGGDCVRLAHAAPPGASEGGSSRGPYGTWTESAGASRHR